MLHKFGGVAYLSLFQPKMVLAEAIGEHTFQTCILVEMAYHFSEFLVIPCQYNCIDKFDE